MASLQELMAASALVVTLERIASRGILPADEEANIRLLICRACRAFEIPTIAERPSNVAVFERVAVREC
jgi:hypothetical protein